MSTKQHPFSFKPEMVRAILADPIRKLQTRRVVTMHNSLIDGTGKGIRTWWPLLDWDRAVAGDGRFLVPRKDTTPGTLPDFVVTPRVQPGHLIRVREAWQPGYDHTSLDAGDDSSSCEVVYRADRAILSRLAPDDVAEQWSRQYAEDGPDDPGWRPSIHMPRWASRAYLPVVGVGAERVNEISDEDAVEEGYPHDRSIDVYERGDAKQWFSHLWESINGQRPGCSWASNPPVWSYRWEQVLSPEEVGS
jgi:hypothetical protein